MEIKGKVHCFFELGTKQPDVVQVGDGRASAVFLHARLNFEASFCNMHVDEGVLSLRARGDVAQGLFAHGVDRVRSERREYAAGSVTRQTG